MAGSAFSGVQIKGLVSAVPGRTIRIDAHEGNISSEDLAKISKMSGVKARRIAKPETTTSDLCFEAASALLQDLNWDPSSVDALIFVSQTPDYSLPATACVLQARLKLPTSCAAFDVSLGCSGYTYGLWLASSLIASKASRRILLLVGDTISKIVSPDDRSTALLFGDAGTATALEVTPDAPTSWYSMGSDGSGAANLIVPGSGFRGGLTASTERSMRDDGNLRGDMDLYMNGGEIFNFTLSAVPQLASDMLELSKLPAEGVDFYVLHQANEFMLKHLSKRMKVPGDKLPLVMENYGNTSSASIPLAICAKLSKVLRSESRVLMMLGFGVGYSWGGALVNVGPLQSCRIVEASHL